MLEIEAIKIVNSLAYYIIFIGAALIPPLFWLWYFRFHDAEHPEPLKLLGVVFLMGSSVCLLLKLIFWAFDFPIFWNSISMGSLDFVESSVLFILLFAFIEETLKFLILRFYVYSKPAFDERIDGIIYGITVGLGFATCENIAHIIISGPETIFSRFATATLLHAVLGGLMGAFISQERFRMMKKCCAIGRALALTTILHFVYNIFGIYDLTGLGIRGEVLLVFGIFFVLMWVIIWIKKQPCRLPPLDKNK